MVGGGSGTGYEVRLPEDDSLDMQISAYGLESADKRSCRQGDSQGVVLVGEFQIDELS